MASQQELAELEALEQRIVSARDSGEYPPLNFFKSQ